MAREGTCLSTEHDRLSAKVRGNESRFPGISSRRLIRTSRTDRRDQRDSHLFGDSKEKQLTNYVDQLLADDILSDDEQDKLFEFARSLGIDLNQYLNRHPATQD